MLIMDDGVVIKIFPGPGALAEYVASWLVARARAKQGNFVVALSGGSTPRALYELLADPHWAMQMPWQRVHLVWGDERFVPHDHPDSNYRMVQEALLDRVPIRPENIHPIRVESTPAAAAADYQGRLQRLYGAEKLDPRRPLFDVVLLGLGVDGHTASLFPGAAALNESSRWVVPVVGAKPEPRITLTFPALNSSAITAFLIAGADKHATWKRLRSLDPALPSTGIIPLGALHFYIDQAAAYGRAIP